jgi:hypothetical protein
MRLAGLLIIIVLVAVQSRAATPQDAPPDSAAPESAPSSAAPAPPAAEPAADKPAPEQAAPDAAKTDETTTDQTPVPEAEALPMGAPSDDYGLVAWCYGALDEYLAIYEVVKPDLKDIDKMFGTPVKETDPYSEDVAEERVALKRFADAMEAAEKASPRPISAMGARDIAKGRDVWAAARLQAHRKLADAWLYWGVPNRCETTARSLKARSTLLGQALAEDTPQPDAPPPAAAADQAAPGPAPTVDTLLDKASDAGGDAPGPPPAAPAPDAAAPTDAKN